MIVSTRALISLAGLAWCCSLALGQATINPRLQNNVVAPRTVYTAPLPTYGGFYPGRVGGTLYGTADLTRAQGQYLNDYQAARITNQQAEQEKIKTRQMLAEQRALEEANRPNYDKIRDKERERQLRRAVNDPPVTEVYDGTALNRLLESGQDLQRRQVLGPPVPVDQATLSHINVKGGGGGNFGVFKSGKLRWPLLLREDFFEKETKKVDELVALALSQIKEDQLRPATLRNLQEAIRVLNYKLEEKRDEMDTSDYMQSKRYIRELDDGVNALKDPNAPNYFNGTWSLRGQTVADVINDMTRKGLRFAAASPGDESFYKAFHESMATYIIRAGAVASR